MSIYDVVLDTDNTWIRTPFIVKLGDDLNSLKEALDYQMAHEIRIQKGNNGDALNELLQAGSDKANPSWFTKPYFADTRVGGNDALNPFWQFGVDDDIRHPITQSREGDNEGMGRVYGEKIEANQHIVWFTFGVAEFAEVLTFYKDAIKDDLVKLMMNGEASTIKQIGNMLADVVGMVVTFPFQALIWLNKAYNSATTMKVSRYYDFRQSMLLYYEFVNSILVHLSINMQMYGEQEHLQMNPTNDDFAPKFLRKTGPDIFAIMQRRSLRASSDNTGFMSTEERLKNAVNGDPNRKNRWWELFIANEAVNTSLGIADYVGLRINKSTDASESFSNQTGESALASALNSRVAAAADSNFSSGGFMGEAKAVLTGISSVAGLDGLASAFLGTAFIDIPEVWKSSSFGKTYSFDFPLRSPYGDPISIMQSIYIPLAVILAGCLPRGTGPNSYSSPFLCRMFCKGMFACPLGIFDSIQIRRGVGEYGWNESNLPVAVDVSVSVRDLSPVLYMNMGTDSWTDVFGQNSSFQEYLLTLSGMGLAERVSTFKNFARRAQILAKLRTSTGGYLGFIGGNPHYWSMKIGDSGLARTIAAITPYNLLSRQ